MSLSAYAGCPVKTGGSSELDCLNTKIRLLSAECSVLGKRVVEALQDSEICWAVCPGGKLVSHQIDILHLLLGPCACVTLRLCGVPVERIPILGR